MSHSARFSPGPPRLCAHTLQVFWKNPAQGGPDPNCDSRSPCFCHQQAGQTTPVKDLWRSALSTAYTESSFAFCASALSKATVGTDTYYLDSAPRIGSRSYSDGCTADDDDDDDCVVNGERLDPRGSAVYRKYWTGASYRRVVFASCAPPLPPPLLHLPHPPPRAITTALPLPALLGAASCSS